MRCGRTPSSGWKRRARRWCFRRLALPASTRERKTVAELCRDDRLAEINDVTALPSRAGRPFVAGPLVNVYNEGAARFLAARGAVTLCTPVELPLTSVAVIARSCPELEIEVFAFGRLPLALSSRCYHARLHGLHKDSCQFVCEKDPDGLAVDTIDGQPFLAVNGVQTLSQGVQAYCPTAERGRVLRHPPLAAFAPYRGYVRGERDLPRSAGWRFTTGRGPRAAFRLKLAGRADRRLYARCARLRPRRRRLDGLRVPCPRKRVSIQELRGLASEWAASRRPAAQAHIFPQPARRYNKIGRNPHAAAILSSHSRFSPVTRPFL